MLTPIFFRFHEESEEIRLKHGNQWTHPPILIELMTKAKGQGLWNLFMPVDSAAIAGGGPGLGAGLTNRQYAEVCEILYVPRV